MQSSGHAAITQLKIADYGGLGFELEGAADALRKLADAVEQEVRVCIAADDDGAGSVTAVRSNGLLVVSHTGPHVRLAGSASALKHFAQALRFVANGPRVPSSVKYHSHLEHYEGHSWIAEVSEPVVVVLAE